MKNLLIIYAFLVTFSASAQSGQWQLCNKDSCGSFNYKFWESQGKLFCSSCISQDGGFTWTMPTGAIGAYSFEKNSAGLFAGTTSAIYFSDDNGVTWTDVHNFGTLNFVFGMARLNDSIFAGTRSQGIWMTPDNGATWTAMNSGLPNDSVHSLMAVGNLLYAGTYGNGVYISDNSGVSWTAANIGLPANAIIRTMAADAVNIYATTYSDLYYSGNNGVSWTQATIPSTHVGNVIAVGNIVLAGGYNDSGTEGLFRSLDHGVTWSLFDMGLPNPCQYVISTLYVSPNYVFCGLGESISCTIDIYRMELNDVTASISENVDLNQFQVEAFPNPFSDVINLKTNLNSSADLFIYDVMKREIIKQPFTTSVSVNASQLENGIYLYEIRNETGLLYSGKMIK